jgi:hypothetical protein
MDSLVVPDDPAELLALAEGEEWGDGLPLVPPTEARVMAMLEAQGLTPDVELARLAPAWAPASARVVAANAVMAGCAPEHFSIVVAAVRALADPVFNLHGIQTTTNPVGVAVVVNGPLRERAKVHSGTGCLGPGWRANATIGRALRLILMNVGGGRPRQMDAATHGFPGKYGMCFAENEEANPWEPLHVSRGLDVDDGAVTVIGVSGTVSVIESTSSADELASVIGRSLYYPGSNDYLYHGEPVVLLGPEHARVFAGAGMSRADVQAAMHAASFVPVDSFSGPNVEYCLSRTRERDIVVRDGLEMVAAASEPAGIHLVVAGGPSIHSTVLPTYGVTRMVTMAVPAFPS